MTPITTSRSSSYGFDFERGSNIARDSSDPSGKTVSSTSLSKGHAIVCAPMNGKCSWEFQITKDVRDNEMSCFGFSTSPTPSKSDYDTSPELYMYRAYNGATYAKGVAGKTITKFHLDDVVRFEAGK